MTVQVFSDQQTERSINRVFSHLLGQGMDFGLGNRVYSQRAARCIVTHSTPGRWGNAEWPVSVQRIGLSVSYGNSQVCL